jgi:hypothetical protein
MRATFSYSGRLGHWCGLIEYLSQRSESISSDCITELGVDDL